MSHLYNRVRVPLEEEDRYHHHLLERRELEERWVVTGEVAFWMEWYLGMDETQEEEYARSSARARRLK
jgi:hypothetical protein